MLRRATSPTRAVRDTPWGGGDWATGGDQSGDLAAAAVGDLAAATAGDLAATTAGGDLARRTTAGGDLAAATAGDDLAAAAGSGESSCRSPRTSGRQ